MSSSDCWSPTTRIKPRGRNDSSRRAARANPQDSSTVSSWPSSSGCWPERTVIRALSIADVVEDLLSGDDRVVEHHDEVRAALADYRSRRVDFIDAVIFRINRARGCEATATFGQRAARLTGFVAVR